MADLTREQIEAVKVLADAATKGPWESHGPDDEEAAWVGKPREDGYAEIICEGFFPEYPASQIKNNFDFIAAANPAMVLSLIEAALQAPQFQPAPPSDVVEADLAKNWAAFCDADNFVGAHDFPERMEAAGLIELVPVDDDALDDAFAADRGIVKGGNMWVLSERGRAAIEAITRLGVKGE